jgi:NAD-dependent dihydropyrimidine dehydrogenase PreA subunit
LNQEEIMAQRGDLETLVAERLERRPVADPERCSQCGVCVEQCPQGALAFKDNSETPVVDEDACIACYCCQEMCPEKAMTLKAPEQPAGADV